MTSPEHALPTGERKSYELAQTLADALIPFDDPQGREAATHAYAALLRPRWTFEGQKTVADTVEDVTDVALRERQFMEHLPEFLELLREMAAINLGSEGKI